MKKNKLIVGIIASIINIPISTILAGLVHIQLSKIAIPKSIYDFQKIVVNEKFLPLFFLMFTLFEVLIFAMLTINKNSYESEIEKITDKIKTPKAIGQGQYGTARWQTNKEFEKNFKCNKLPLNDNGEYKASKGGLVVGYKKTKKEEQIYFVDENIHSLTVGATRSGKTRSVVLQTIGNLALAGESMILSDPKGELYQYTYPYLISKGYKIITLDFKNPTKSNKYNFLQPVIDAVNREDYRKAEEYAWDITASLVGDDNGHTEKIWRDGEMSVIAGAIMSVVFDNKNNPEYQNLTNVYMFISEMCKTVGNNQMPINRYIECLAPDHPATSIFSIARIAPDKTRGSFFTSALTTLRLFTNKSIYSMTCESDFSLTDAGKERIATFIILPDEKTTYYSLASLFVYQNYVALVEKADSRGGELFKRVNYILDEFGNFSTIPAFQNMLTVAGGRKIRFNLFLQSFAQLENKYGKEVAENIRDNCQTWLYLKTASTETATTISKKLGCYSTSSYSRSSSYTRYQSGSNSESMNLISRPLLTEDEIMRIERPYLLVIPTGMFPVMSTLPDISKWKFNKMFGMGNQDHNRKLREEREKAREEREIKEMQLWGIWKLFNNTRR